MRILLWCVACALMVAAQAQDRPPTAPAEPLQDAGLSAAETQRLKALSAELRCLVCQNQSLADSHADLAIDLRNQVRDQIRAGQSDDQIKEYLVQRYGEFVLYRPRVSALTGLLWAGPFLLLLLGAVAMWAYLRRRQRTPSGDAEEESRLEQARSLLRGEPGSDGKQGETAP